MSANFYIFDDLKNNVERTRENPDAQYVGRWCDAWEVDRVNGESEKCPLCGRHVSTLKWLEPRKMRLTSTKYPDRLTTWLAEPMVVSKQVMEVYKQDQLTGIQEFIPIKVVRVARVREETPLLPEYFCGEIAFTTSVQIDLNNTKIDGQKCDWRCELCNPRGTTMDKISKLSLDTAKWDGDDVFKVYGLGAVVSQRFYDFVQKYNFTNFNLVSIEEYNRV